MVRSIVIGACIAVGLACLYMAGWAVSGYEYNLSDGDRWFMVAACLLVALLCLLVGWAYWRKPPEAEPTID